jgi:hypothetical protein
MRSPLNRIRIEPGRTERPVWTLFRPRSSLGIFAALGSGGLESASGAPNPGDSRAP